MSEQQDVQVQSKEGDAKRRKALRSPEGTPVEVGLKAERVQVASSADMSAEEVRARLKAERVQLALKAIPDWTRQPDGESLQRVRQFPQGASAKAYVGFVLEVASAFKLPVSLQWADRQLVITLRGFSQKSRQNGLTTAMVNLATALG
jgi:pterin-4a-carbinolamine dehydratase